MNEQTRQDIESLVASDRVVLFMKGNRQQPQCGFSATAVQILDELVPDYTTVDVLAHPAVRDGIEGFSATVVPILAELAPDYTTVDVLANPAIRDGIKVFSSWPTIPQLYVAGEVIGGRGQSRGALSTRG